MKKAGPPTPEPSKMIFPPGKSFAVIMFAVLAAWIAMSFFTPDREIGTEIPYNTFKNELKAGNVERITIQGENIRGALKTQASRQAGDQVQEYQEFTTYLPSFGDEGLMADIEAQGVELVAKPEEQDGYFWYAVLSFLPFLLLIGFFYFQYRRIGGQTQSIFNVGKSRARLYEKTSSRTMFADVAGAEDAKQELSEIVSYLKDPRRLERLGGQVPKGVLLVGAPGTGKTLLARAVAGEADVPFFSITGSDFMEMFVGVGASRVRSLFNDAKKEAPSIIFIDELDSIGRTRGTGIGGGHDEREQTLNQLLSEMDGFEPNIGVIVMSATNRPDILDPALLRPGRFDRRVVVQMPTTKEREQILAIHAKGKPLAEDVDLASLAKATPGFSGADLENVLNEAALLAARRDRDKILDQDVQEARDKVLLGLERRGLAVTGEERRIMAYHETGHAVAAAVLPKADPVYKVSIVPRSKSMGATQQLPEREKYIYDRSYLMDRISVMMGGRAAEELVFGTATSGAGNDLQQAAKLARSMILEWGMSEKFRNMALGAEHRNVFLGEELTRGRDYSEATAREVDEEVRGILTEAYDSTMKVLKDHRESMDRLVEELLQKEDLPGKRVLEVLGLSPEELGKKEREIVQEKEI